MNRAISMSITTLLGASLALAAPVASAEAASKTYKNCTEFNKVYKHGVAKKKAKDLIKGKFVEGKSVTAFKVSDSIYKTAVKTNRRLDVDKDGVACEKGVTKSAPKPGPKPAPQPQPCPPGYAHSSPDDANCVSTQPPPPRPRPIQRCTVRQSEYHGFALTITGTTAYDRCNDIVQGSGWYYGQVPSTSREICLVHGSNDVLVWDSFSAQSGYNFCGQAQADGYWVEYASQ